MTDAALLLLVVEDWARLTARHRPAAAPVAALHAALTRLAEQAPAAAATCPALLRLLGPSVAHRVKVQASALAVSDPLAAAVERASWITTAQAAAALGITPHGVRDLLRRRQLVGRRRDGGPWEVSAASVRARRTDRAA